jgi:cell division transport system permease protein
MRLKYILNEVLVGLWRNVTMTVAMIITMSVSLAMLGASVLLYMQVDQMKSYYYGEIEVSVFLKNDITDTQRQAIDSAIAQSPLVKSRTYETKEQAFNRFKELWQDSPDFVKSIGPNSLPESFRVKLKNPETRSRACRGSTRSSTSAHCSTRSSRSSTRSRCSRSWWLG